MYTLFLVILVYFCRNVSTNDCLLNATLYYSPLLIKETLTFAAPAKDNLHHFVPGDVFYVTCPRGTQSPKISEEGDGFRCDNGTIITNMKSGDRLNFNTIKCKSELGVVRRTGERCENNYTKIEIGAHIGENFVASVIVCFNEADVVPFYVEYNTSDYSTCGLCGPSTVTYVDGANLYPIDLDEMYNNYVNMKEIEDNLGVVNFTAIWRQSLIKSDHFFDVLGAKSDYATVIPGLISNQGIGSCDKFLKNDTQETHIFGTLGVTTMKRRDGEFVEIYLDNGRVPIPRWTWCIAYTQSYEIDGFFYFQLVDRQVEAIDVYAEEWLSQICEVDNLMSDLSYLRGYCPFEKIIHPLLRSVVENKWPQVRNK